MRELVFALEFRGRGGPVPGSDHQAPGAHHRAQPDLRAAILGRRRRPSAAVEPVAGETAVLESRVERFADGTFVEDGTITYGRAGSVTFDTVGRGHVGPAPDGPGATASSCGGSPAATAASPAPGA